MTNPNHFSHYRTQVRQIAQRQQPKPKPGMYDSYADVPWLSIAVLVGCVVTGVVLLALHAR